MSDAKLDDLTLDEALDMRSALVALQKSDGWKVLVAIWEKDLEMQRNAFGGPIKSEFELYAQEYTKGAVAQIRSDIGLPAALIDSLNTQIDTHPGNKETSNANRSPSADDHEGAGSADDGGSSGSVP